MRSEPRRVFCTLAPVINNRDVPQSAAIAAVTVALKTLLEAAFKAAEDRQLADALVTAMPVDRARSIHHRCQVNITLATVQENTSVRNQPLGLRGAATPAAARRAMDLTYLVTTYGPEDDEVAAQRVMGVALTALHAQPVLPTLDLAAMFPHTGAAGVLDQLKLTQVTLSREQIVAWWLAFHTPYRLSCAWQVTGVALQAATTGTGSVVQLPGETTGQG